MADDEEGGGLGERLSIAMAGVPVPDDDDEPVLAGRRGVDRRGADLLAGLEVDDAVHLLALEQVELDLLEPDADLLDEAVDDISASNPAPAFRSVSVRPAPPRPPLPVRRPSGSAPRERDPMPQDRISNEPPVAFPPPASEPPPGRGSGIDFEKVLATASMSPRPKPVAPTLDLAMAPPAPSIPVEARSGVGRTVMFVALAAAAAFAAVAWFLRVPEREPALLALGPIESAPRTSAGDPDARSTRATSEPSVTRESESGGDERDAVGWTPIEAMGAVESATAPVETTRVEAPGSEAREENALEETAHAETALEETALEETARADTTRAEVRERDTSTATTEPELVQVDRAVEVAPAPPPTDLPEEPTRDEVQAALSAVRPAVRSCVQPGAQVRVRITIATSGRVTTAVVEDDIWSRQPHGGCIARAVRTASFPRFSRDRFVVVFPFQF